MSKRRANGEGSIRLRSDGRWEGRYWTEAGRRRSGLGRTKDAAARALRDATIARDRGDLAAPAKERVAGYLRPWLRALQASLRHLRPQSYQGLHRTQT